MSSAAGMRGMMLGYVCACIACYDEAGSNCNTWMFCCPNLQCSGSSCKRSCYLCRTFTLLASLSSRTRRRVYTQSPTTILGAAVVTTKPVLLPHMLLPAGSADRVRCTAFSRYATKRIRLSFTGALRTSTLPGKKLTIFVMLRRAGAILSGDAGVEPFVCCAPFHLVVRSKQ